MLNCVLLFLFWFVVIFTDISLCSTFNDESIRSNIIDGIVSKCGDVIVVCSS